MQPLIRAEGLRVCRAGRAVLEGVSISIAPGEIVTVIGPNGSGKTTLLRVLVGALRPDEGRVWRRPGLAIGYVPQRLFLDRSLPLSVGRFLSLPERHDAAEGAAALHRVGIADCADQPLAALSGGQFQRALLARAILGRPDILALDEPTQGLDQPGIAGFYRLLEEVRAELGCAVLLVSHDLHVVMAASDRVICLNAHVCCEGAPAVVSEAPEYRALFGAGTGGTMALYQHHHDHSHDSPGIGGHPPEGDAERETANVR